MGWMGIRYSIPTLSWRDLYGTYGGLIMNKPTYEFTDALSVFANGMQTLTKEVVRGGEIDNSNITLGYFDDDNNELIVTCKMGDTVTHLLLTADNRLPCGDSRDTIVSNGLDFLFTNKESGPNTKWEYSFDLSDDEFEVKYELKNMFIDSYSEYPMRDLLSDVNLQMFLGLYFPVAGKQENVDGIAVIEIGNDLTNNSGLVSYYSFRIIEKEFVSKL
jgi:hypothetical protein